MKIVEAKLEGSDLSLRVNPSRLDALTAAEFKKDCAEIWQQGIASVRVDLSEVQFIDSSGVGALLSIYKRLPAPNPTVKLECVQPAVQAVIELLRLHRIFEIEG
ncbi:MAG: STAS domain-containing protein [Verrucomicrobiota bacterium]